MTNNVTQSCLTDTDAALNTLGVDLLAHLASSLAKAHGINVLYFPTPVYDDSGNNIQYYFDSAGDTVGIYQLRFTVNNVVYYAPANATSLTGQTTAVTLLSDEDVSAQLAARDDTALVTTFISAEVAYTDAVRDQILIPHAQLGHWEAHAPITVRSRTTTDSRGNVIGRFAATIQFNGVKYDIPCDTQLGGPPRAPGVTNCPAITWTGGLNGNFSLNGCTVFMHVSAGDPWPTGFTLIFSGLTGSKPMTYKWEYSINGTDWTVFPTGSFVSNAGSGALKLNIDPQGSVSGSTHSGVFLIQSPGGDSGGTLYMRVTFTNSGGSVSGCVIKGDMKDASDSCHIFTAAVRAGYMDEEDLLTAVRYRITAQRKHVLSEIEWGGYSVFGRWIARFIKTKTRFSKALMAFFVRPLRHRFLYEMDRAPFAVWPTLVGWFLRLTLPIVYAFNRKTARRVMTNMSGEDYIRSYHAKVKQLRELRQREQQAKPGQCCCGGGKCG